MPIKAYMKYELSYTKAEKMLAQREVKLRKLSKAVKQARKVLDLERELEHEIWQLQDLIKRQIVEFS